MSRNELRAELERLAYLLIETGVAYAIRPVVLTRLSDRYQITWPVSATGDSRLFHRPFGSTDEYLGWLDADAYTAILLDGAILQLSYDLTLVGDDIIAYRLLYHPCPFDLDVSLLEELPLAEVVRLHQNHLERLAVTSPLRFDYDPGAQGPDHPSSHLTILSERCRLAVVAPLSPGHFIRFVFRHFYPDIWAGYPALREWPQRLGPRTITADEEGLLHVSCVR